MFRVCWPTSTREIQPSWVFRQSSEMFGKLPNYRIFYSGRVELVFKPCICLCINFDILPLCPAMGLPISWCLCNAWTAWQINGLKFSDSSFDRWTVLREGIWKSLINAVCPMFFFLALVHLLSRFCVLNSCRTRSPLLVQTTWFLSLSNLLSFSQCFYRSLPSYSFLSFSSMLGFDLTQKHIYIHYITLHYITLHCIALHCIHTCTHIWMNGSIHRYMHTYKHTYIAWNLKRDAWGGRERSAVKPTRIWDMGDATQQSKAPDLSAATERTKDLRTAWITHSRYCNHNRANQTTKHRTDKKSDILLGKASS